jgi:hypothetical protein
MSDLSNQSWSADQNREGGAAEQASSHVSIQNSQNQIQNPNGDGIHHLPIGESTLTNVAPPPIKVSPPNPNPIFGGSVIGTFEFPSKAFSHPVQPEITLMKQNNSAGLVFSSQPSASKEPQRGGDNSFAGGAVLPSFKTLSASGLAKIIGDKIQNFKPEFWIEEDVNGAAFLEVVSPPQLSEFLQHQMLISSNFQRTRIANLLRDMIKNDKSLSDVERGSWSEPSLAAATPVHQTSSNLGENFSPNIQKQLFVTPERVKPSAAPFLKEIKGKVDFGLNDAELFSSDYTQARVTVAGTPGGAPSAEFTDASMMPNGGFTFNISSSTADKPNYMILDACDNPTEFFKWLRKNREESELALPVNRRPLKDLLTKDAKLEVARCILKASTEDVDLFDKDAPYPNKGWVSVTDKLLLKVLHKKNGPPCASEAKQKLKETVFYFNDATTEQKLFTAKFRKHCKKITEHIENFDYMYRLWPAHDSILSHAMIIDAFSEGFNDKSTVLGADNTSQVPKCRNLTKIREMIREKKELPLEDLMTHIIDHFERLDTTIRSNPQAKYELYPWRKSDQPGQAGNKRKRNFNQVEAGGGAAGNAKHQKPPRPPTTFPRCANCGSKGHLCGERTCFLFGHPKAKGVDGEWPEGSPSLRLAPDEYKAWSAKRKPVFFSYPENKGPSSSS